MVRRELMTNLDLKPETPTVISSHLSRDSSHLLSIVRARYYHCIMENKTKWGWIEFMELGIATVIYVGFISGIFAKAPVHAESGLLVPYTSPFIQHLAESTMLYLAFVIGNFYIVPGLLVPAHRKVNVILTLLIGGLITGLFLDISATAIAFSSFFLYSLIRYALIFISQRSKAIRTQYRFLAPGVVLALAIWVVSMVFLLMAEPAPEAVVAWMTLVPFGLLFYSYSFFVLLPRLQQKRSPFWAFVMRAAFLLIVTAIPVGLLSATIAGKRDDADAISFGLLNYLFQFFITTPFSWIAYKKYAHENDEIVSLQKELGQSHASLDFLKSQINPHFLFNALNTLYGTALQEKAERTSEGIQKLGDMMRFMLRENIQDRISVNREIEYLKNYISLQKLRTDLNPEITIEEQLPDGEFSDQISPMLLIPFVENAFKHGISFQTLSYIRIILQIRSHVLEFEVVNSNPPKRSNDPELQNNGIGLSNVRERLKLLYPEKHHLIVRESEKEFFIHLTIDLN